MRKLAVLAAALLVGVLAPAAALATWSSTVAGGSMTVSTATLDAPTGLTATNNTRTCARFKPTTLEVDLTWTPATSPRVTGYTVLRNGAQVGTVSGASSTGWSDTTRQLGFSQTYTYTVESTVGGWTSPAATVTITTLSNRCR